MVVVDEGAGERVDSDGVAVGAGVVDGLEVGVVLATPAVDEREREYHRLELDLLRSCYILRSQACRRR